MYQIGAYDEHMGMRFQVSATLSTYEVAEMVLKTVKKSKQYLCGVMTDVQIERIPDDYIVEIWDYADV